MIRKSQIYIPLLLMGITIIALIFLFVAKFDKPIHFEIVQYINTIVDNNVMISLPQISGSKNKIKEQTINQLIENDAKRIMRGCALFEEHHLLLKLDCEIKLLNNNLVSLIYYGYKGANGFGYRSYPEAIATTIDVEKAKILTLHDVISELDVLYDMLITGTFEAISVWEGRVSDHLIEYYSTEIFHDILKSALDSNEYNSSSRYLEWYIDSDNFVIVLIGLNQYEEYSIPIEQIAHVLNDNILALIK